MNSLQEKNLFEKIKAKLKAKEMAREYGVYKTLVSGATTVYTDYGASENKKEKPKKVNYVDLEQL